MLLFYEDDEILTNVCWAYCHLLRQLEINSEQMQKYAVSENDLIREYTKKAIFDKKFIDDYTHHWQRKFKLHIPSDIIREIYTFYAIFHMNKVKLFHNNIIKQIIYLFNCDNQNVKHSAIVAFGNMQRYMNEYEI